MIDQLIEYDKSLLRFLNGYHASWLDPVMLTLTATAAWIPLYIFLIYVVVKDYKKRMLDYPARHCAYNSPRRSNHGEYYETILCAITAFP